MISDSTADVLAACGFGLVLGGLVRYVYRHRTRAGRKPDAALAAAVVMVVLGLGELALRWAGVPRYVGLALVGAPLDVELGWRGDFAIGDPATQRKRVLVIGDSFTDAPGIPRADRYYQALARDLGYEVWAFAASGWGTLQESLVLQREFERVRPQLVVWQICSNDFINNDWELERGNYALNNLSVRPFWEHERVVFRSTSPLVPLRRFLAERFCLASWLSGQLQRFWVAAEMRGWVEGSKRRIKREGTAFPAFARSVATTEALTRRIVARTDGQPLVAVPADAYAPYAQEWEAILHRQGVPLLREGLESVRAAKQRGEEVHMPDGAHWSARGHALVGAALSRWVAGRRAPNAGER